MKYIGTIALAGILTGCTFGISGLPSPPKAPDNARLVRQLHDEMEQAVVQQVRRYNLIRLDWSTGFTQLTYGRFLMLAVETESEAIPLPDTPERKYSAEARYKAKMALGKFVEEAGYWEKRPGLILMPHEVKKAVRFVGFLEFTGLTRKEVDFLKKLEPKSTNVTDTDEGGRPVIRDATQFEWVGLVPYNPPVNRYYGNVVVTDEPLGTLLTLGGRRMVIKGAKGVERHFRHYGPAPAVVSLTSAPRAAAPAPPAAPVARTPAPSPPAHVVVTLKIEGDGKVMWNGREVAANRYRWPTGTVANLEAVDGAHRFKEWDIDGRKLDKRKAPMTFSGDRTVTARFEAAGGGPGP